MPPSGLSEVKSTLRPAARVLCIDDRQCVLLLRWRDPFDGSYLWEPPGGGLKPGERAIDAARRELAEETGLPGGSVVDRHVMVQRDVRWNGRHYLGEEAFFLARVHHPPPLSRDGLERHEAGWLHGHAWVRWSEIGSLPDRVEPPQLVDVLVALDPAGPWNPGSRQPWTTPPQGGVVAAAQRPLGAAPASCRRTDASGRHQAWGSHPGTGGRGCC
jgi:8-oxo-dGTP pyrophosphatase MutT (NUDIX family)